MSLRPIFLPGCADAPRSVEISVSLLWISISLALLVQMLEAETMVYFIRDAAAELVPDQPSLASGPVFKLGVYRVFTFLLLTPCFWLYRKLARGKNWARLIQLGFGAWGVLSFIEPPNPNLHLMPVSVVLNYGSSILHLAGTVGLFTKRSGEWFNPPSLSPL